MHKFSHFYPEFYYFYIFYYNVNILPFTPSHFRWSEPTATFTRAHPQQSYIYTSAVFSTVRAKLLKEIPYTVFLFCQTVLTLCHSPSLLLMPKVFLSFIYLSYICILVDCQCMVIKLLVFLLPFLLDFRTIS